MPRKKVVKKKHVTITSEAYAEVLFKPGGQIAAWTRRASKAVEEATAIAAPANKRPHWSHNGTPLKKSISSQTSINPVTMQAHFAVGSSSHYAAYVDQGTGSFLAKILPPWSRGSASLYEYSWKPTQNSRPVGKIQVKGQRAQHFFGRGLTDGMAAMGVNLYSSPEGAADTFTFPRHLTDFVDEPFAQSTFDAELKKWREWRDRAWSRGGYLGKVGSKSRNAEIARRRASKSQRRKDRLAERKKRRANSTAMTSAERGRKFREEMARKKGGPKPKRRTKENKAKARQNTSQKADSAKFLAHMRNKYGSANVDALSLERNGAYWEVTVRLKDSTGRYYFDTRRAKAKS